VARRLQCNDRPTAGLSLVRTFPRPQSNRRRLRYAHVPNCAGRGRTGKLGRCRAAEESERGEFERLFHCEFRRRRDTMNTTQGSKIPSPICIGRWTPKILFSLKQRPHRHGELRRRIGSVSQDAYQNPSQSRIHRIDLKTRDVVESHCGRVFPDPTGKDDYRSTRRHVPLGETILQGGEC
jgi:hypothetical protein